MAGVGFAFLCHAARAHDGLVSVLDAGIDRLGGPRFPLLANLDLVAKIEWDDDELGEVHVIRVVVTHSDGEVLAEASLSATPERRPGMAPDLPVGLLFTLPLPFEIRRGNRYDVRLSVDGDELKALPLIASAELPQV